MRIFFFNSFKTRINKMKIYIRGWYYIDISKFKKKKKKKIKFGKIFLLNNLCLKILFRFNNEKNIFKSYFIEII
jgi:hypothetical protein